MEELKEKLSRSYDKNITHLKDINAKYDILTKNIDTTEKIINFTDLRDIIRTYKSSRDIFMTITPR